MSVSTMELGFTIVRRSMKKLELYAMVSSLLTLHSYEWNLAGRVCNDTNIRLVDSETLLDSLEANTSTTDNGQVEICMHGFWGLICADGWDYRDAKIACQQLGYNGCKVTIIIIPMCIFLPSAKTLIQ